MNYLYDTIRIRLKTRLQSGEHLASKHIELWFKVADELLAELVEEGLYTTAIELEEIIEANQKLFPTRRR